MKRPMFLVGFPWLASVLSAMMLKSNRAFAKESVPSTHASQEPLIRLEEINRHSTWDRADPEKRVWVAYQDQVYDITDFIPNHPGGTEKIIMAGGGFLDPFWKIYGIHKTERILNILKPYRIGKLHPDDAKANKDQDTISLYEDQPRRNPALLLHSKEPFNAETPKIFLAESFQTPNDLFFIRNHMAVPKVDPEHYQLSLDGIGVPQISLSLDDLKQKFKKVSVESVIQCGGNRRADLAKVGPVHGLQWGGSAGAAAGNAVWGGVLLRDVLESFGLNENNYKNSGAKHVQFQGLDHDDISGSYGTSIPIEKALGEYGDVLLAWEMNGEEIPRDHGFPLRVIVPGAVGARNVKWVEKITVSPEESDTHWQRKDYKLLSSNIKSLADPNINLAEIPSIQEMPLQSQICNPANGSQIDTSQPEIEVKGYALASGGKGIARVDLMVNDTDYQPTHLQRSNTLPQADSSRKNWSWTLWAATVPAKFDHNGEMKICSNAVDMAGNTQPATPLWNVRGFLCNAIDCITVKKKDNHK